MKETNTKITRYENNGFYFDIVNDGKTIEAWIQKRPFGIAQFIIGLQLKNTTESEFLEFIKNNAEYYKRDYMDYIEALENIDINQIINNKYDKG